MPTLNVNRAVTAANPASARDSVPWVRKLATALIAQANWTAWTAIRAMVIVLSGENIPGDGILSKFSIRTLPASKRTRYRLTANEP